MTAITGFGRDIFFGPKGLKTGRYSSGITLLAWAAFRRLNTPRGTLRGGEDEANYGIDLSEYVGEVGGSSAVLSLPGVVRAELSKDERILDVNVPSPTTTTDEAGLVHITLPVEVQPADESGSFRLTLDVSSVAVILLGIDPL